MAAQGQAIDDRLLTKVEIKVSQYRHLTNVRR